MREWLDSFTHEREVGEKGSRQGNIWQSLPSESRLTAALFVSTVAVYTYPRVVARSS
jgi:hypothetical protein